MRSGTIQITVETQSTLIIRGVNPVRAQCLPAIVQWHETGMSGGLAQICLDFLLRAARRVLPKPQVRKASNRGDD
jgi:hypothetical protein